MGPNIRRAGMDTYGKNLKSDESPKKSPKEQLEEAERWLRHRDPWDEIPTKRQK